MYKLNQRQRMFTINYFKTGNATQSAINAGYAPTRAEVTGSELVRNSKVSEYLAELNTQMQTSVVTKKEQKLQKLEQIYEHEPLPETISARDRILAISEHNKMDGDYAPEKHALLGNIVIEVIYRDK